MVGSPIYMAPEVLKGYWLIIKDKTIILKLIYGQLGFAFLKCFMDIVLIMTRPFNCFLKKLKKIN